MPRSRPDVTNAELAVLGDLWEHGESTIRALTDRLYPDGGTVHYATVQKLLERLQAKSWVRRRKPARVNVYAATVGRETLIAQRLAETAEKLCGGSLTPLLTHLVSSSKLDAQELERLRSMVDELAAERRENRGR